MIKLMEKNPLLMMVIGLFGLSLSAIIVKYTSAPSAVTAACRLLWAVALMSPVVWGKRTVREELLHISRKEAALSMISGLFLAVHFYLWFESLHYATVASASTIVSTEVIWVSLGYCLFMKGKLSPKAIAFIAVTLAGSVVIAYSDSSAGEVHFYGDILALLAAVTVAVYTLLGRRVRANVSNTVYTYIVYSSCAAALVLACIAAGYSLSDCGADVVIVGFLLAVVSTFLGHSIFNWCIKYFSPAFVSASKLCQPVIAAVFAAVLFREVPTVMQVIGAVFILSGVYGYSRFAQEKA